MKYVVQVDGRAIEVEVDGEQGDPRRAGVPRNARRGCRHAASPADDRRKAGHSLPSSRWGAAAGHCPAGGPLEVEVLDERTRHIRSLTGRRRPPEGARCAQGADAGAGGAVRVKPGDAVAAGAGLVVLEAMKMENELKAPAAAVVKAVRVAPGEAVEKGQVLLEFEPDTTPT